MMRNDTFFLQTDKYMYVILKSINNAVIYTTFDTVVDI